MKKLFLITALCFAFNVNSQFRLVKDLYIGNNNSFPSSFYEYNGRLFFSADDAVPSTTNLGRDIYVTDGTNVGTEVITLHPSSSASLIKVGSRNGLPITFFEYNSELYFNANFWSGGSIRNYALKLIGNNNHAEIGGVMNFQLTAGTVSAELRDPCVFNNKIIFSPASTENGNVNPAGIEPFVIDLSNSSNDGVLFDVYPGMIPPNNWDPNNSLPSSFTALSSGVLFSAYNPTNGRELWKTDGTTAGTVLFQDINSGAGDSNPDNFNVLGSQLTFAATHSTLGRELFKTNGNTGNLVLIKDINTSGNSNPTNVKNINGALYFSADNGSVGQELWKSNGFNSGTSLVKDINPSGNSNPSKFIQFGTDVYFIADDGVNGVELWKTDGSPVGTDMVKDINPTGSSSPNYFTEYNGRLYFTANDGVNGTELWVTDGTAAGTVMIELNPNGDASLSNLIVFNNELYFSGDDSVSGVGKELWAYKDPALSANDFQLNGKSISLYPNPAKGVFQLQTEIEINKVEVYSLQGQLVKSFTLQNQYEVSDLAKGMYLVKINTQEGSLNKTLILE